MWQALLAEATRRREGALAAARSAPAEEQGPPVKTVGFAGLARMMMSKGR